MAVEFTSLEFKGCSIPQMLLAQHPGGAKERLVSHSHFLQPLAPTADNGGRSRRWGDAGVFTQVTVIDTLLAEARRNDLSLQEAAFVLGLVRVESGFNPDAASRSSSASGLGQFIDRTGTAFGLEAGTRFSVAESARAIVAYVRDCFWRVDRERKNYSPYDRFVRAYAIYHDGPKYTEVGLEIAAAHVLPWTKKFYSWLQACATP